MRKRFFESKEGISGILITVIMIGLVLVVVGLVWAVVNNLVGSRIKSATVNAQCLEVGLRPTTANCSDTACNVWIKRDAGGGSIAGVVYIFYRGDGTTQENVTIGNVAPLATNMVYLKGIPSNPEKVEVSAYFLDENGDRQVCSQSSAYVINPTA